VKKNWNIFPISDKDLKSKVKKERGIEEEKYKISEQTKILLLFQKNSTLSVLLINCLSKLKNDNARNIHENSSMIQIVKGVSVARVRLSFAISFKYLKKENEK